MQDKVWLDRKSQVNWTLKIITKNSLKCETCITSDAFMMFTFNFLCDKSSYILLYIFTYKKLTVLKNILIVSTGWLGKVMKISWWKLFDKRYFLINTSLCNLFSIYMSVSIEDTGVPFPKNIFTCHPFLIHSHKEASDDDQTAHDGLQRGALL